MELNRRYRGLGENVKTGIDHASEAMAGHVDEELAKGTWKIKSKTGNLRQSIGHRVMQIGQSWVGIVGTNMVYARIQEVGGEVTVTWKMRNKMFYLWKETGNELYYKLGLKTPGTKIKIPAHWYMKQTAEKYQDDVTAILEKDI